MTYLYKNRGFWEALEPIRVLCANRDGYSYIRVTFREQHLEKQPLEENTHNYIQNNHIHKINTYRARKLYKLYKQISSYTRRLY